MIPARILIVEDEFMLSKAMARHLTKAGYEVVGQVTSGEEAAKTAQQEQPDLILMDITLAGEMDGIEAARQIRGLSDIPIIFLTAHSEDQFFERAKTTGPLAYLTKPISPQDLVHTVEMSLSRYKMESRLRQSEERFRQLAENIGEVFWLTHPGKPKRIVYLNPAHEKIWGIKREDVYSAPGMWLRSLHEDDRDFVVEAYEEFLQGFRDYDVEYRIVRPDGSTRWVWDRAFPIKDDKGRIHRVAGLVQDITRRKEDQKKQAALMEEIKHFAYIVSHDLRAPLTNLRGFSNELESAMEIIRPVVQMSLDRLSEKEQRQTRIAMDQDVPEALDFIRLAVSKMDSLITAILKLSRVGRVELLFEPVDVSELVSAIVKTMSHEINISDVKVIVKDLPAVVADRTALEQIFGNLIHNAIKYRDPKRPQEITISGYQVSDEVIFVVGDNGRGIERGYISKIFEIFERGDVTEIPGEGMGLTYVRTLVRRHGGQVWCESEPGVGSTFTFTISNRLADSGNFSRI